MLLCRTIDIGFYYSFSKNEDNHDNLFSLYLAISFLSLFFA